MFAANRPACEDCRDLCLENGVEPDCAACRRIVFFSRKNAQAWEAWRILDEHARPVDGFSGYPMGISLSVLETVCARYDDPEGVCWRVMLLEEKILQIRRNEWRQKREK